MYLLRVKKLMNLLESVHSDVLHNLQSLIGKVYKYLEHKVTIIEVNNLEMIVIEVETCEGLKFKEFLNFQELKFYLNKLEEL